MDYYYTCREEGGKTILYYKKAASEAEFRTAYKKIGTPVGRVYVVLKNPETEKSKYSGIAAFKELK